MNELIKKNNNKKENLFIKVIITILFLLIPFIGISTEKNSNLYSKNYSVIITAENNSIPYNPVDIFHQNGKWGAFWVNFIISAIGAYSIYGFAAGIVSVGITYFVVNGNKTNFKYAIWGGICGFLLGALIRVLTLL